MTAQRIAIVDYGSGNLRSVAKAFAHIAGPHDHIEVTRFPDDLARADRIVLPGVGAFADCMRGIRDVPGLREALHMQAVVARKPFLGICVGMQLMFEWGCEHGRHEGLGWIQGEVVALSPQDRQLKVPHMGWNELSVCTPHPLMEGIEENSHVYFVHSYHARCGHAADLLAVTDYGGEVTAAVAHGNLAGTQFHPEKSQTAGLQILSNFLRW